MNWVNESSLKKDNVALYLVLKSIECGQSVIVGTTHLYYKDQSVKSTQAKSFLESAQILNQKIGNVPLILTGDYNASPSNSIYKFMELENFKSVYNEVGSCVGQNPFTSFTNLCRNLFR